MPTFKDRKPIQERFEDRVNRDGPVPAHCPELGPCWVWTGGRVQQGYGRLSLPGREAGEIRAHRFSWELHFGPVTDGLQVLHHCDNPPCVNPEHLFLGIAKDNTQDMIIKGRSKWGFKSGHQYYPSVRTKLSIILAYQIRALNKSGIPSVQLAHRFGVSTATISSIIRSQSWI